MQFLYYFQVYIPLIAYFNNTIGVVEHIHKELASTLIIIDVPEAGKGLAIHAGFADALMRENDLIGFVDADMATSPESFFDLIVQLNNYDGVIASRYMPES